MSEIESLKSALNALIGQECWNVSAGAIGSLASIDIGDKVLRDKPLPYPNKNLAPDLHKYRGQYVLYLEDCPWRLDGTDAVIASWMDSNAPNGPIVTGLKQLEGATITHVDLITPAFDLIVSFNNGLILRIFPDQVDPDEGDNYSLSVAGEKHYVIAAKSTLYAD